MTVIARCDRCRAEKFLDTHPTGHADGPHCVDNTLPEHWEMVCSAMLCEKCCIELHEFLSNRPRVTINLKDRVWIKRDGKAHPYQLWDLMHCYGPRLSMSAATPFDENIVYLEEPRP